MTANAYENRLLLSFDFEKGRMRYEAFEGMLRPEARSFLQAHKTEVLAVLTYPQPQQETLPKAPTDGSLSPLALSLYRFCGAYLVVEVKLPWIEPTLFLVPGPPFVEPMLAHVTRGRIWTISEVLDLLLGGATLTCAVEVAKSKLRIDGYVSAIGNGRVIVSSYATKADETIATDLAA